jgi:DNA-binding MarR family transcriptional regulator
MTKAYQPLLEKYHLTYPQYIVMLGVFEDETIDFKDLSEKVNLKTGTLTPIVQKLESLGYVSREKNKDDFRKVNVVLTKKGKSLNMDIVEVPIQLAQKLQISINMYETLVKELDDLDALLTDVIKQ